jgi:hypothetical protein
MVLSNTDAPGFCFALPRPGDAVLTAAKNGYMVKPGRNFLKILA